MVRGGPQRLSDTGFLIPSLLLLVTSEYVVYGWLRRPCVCAVFRRLKAMPLCCSLSSGAPPSLVVNVSGPFSRRRQLEVAFAAGRLHSEIAELSQWSDETSAMVAVLRQLGFVDHSGQGELMEAGIGQGTCKIC